MPPYPPVWLITRRAAEHDIIQNEQLFRIPAGAFVIISPYLINQDPLYWENPEDIRRSVLLPGILPGGTGFPTSRLEVDQVSVLQWAKCVFQGN